MLRISIADTLEILEILSRLGCRGKRMQEALGLVISKKDDGGRWKLESTFNGRFQVNIEQRGNPSKRTAPSALRILKRMYSQTRTNNRESRRMRQVCKGSVAK